VRRSLAAVAAVLVAVLTACSAPQTPAGPGPDTRTVVQALGTVEVPAQPSRILALDEYAALSMLGVGVRPDLVFATLSSQLGGGVLREAGVTVQDEPTFLTEPDIEKTAAAGPDMIVMSDAGSLPAQFERINAVAPTIALLYSAPWRDVVTATGTAFDRPEAAAQLVGRIEGRIAEVRGALGGRPHTLSILLGYAGEVFTPTDTTPLAGLVEEAGFTRIPSEVGLPGTQDGNIAAISAETLGAHDADSAALLNGGYYDSATVRESATYAALPVVRDGRAVDVDGDMWFGSHPFAISWILDDLAAIATGTGAPGTSADAAARWATFQDLVG
jgi:iron complex transport system substrate-binding protein